MALVTFFRSKLLRTFTPKWRNCSVFASSDSQHENTCQDDQKSNDSDDDSGMDPPIIKLETSSDDLKKRLLQKCKILIREPDNFYLISGVPIGLTLTRPAKIYQPAKNAMQSGTRHLGHWVLDFETKERWENPIMGWCSSGDALSNVQMRFSTAEKAINYCKKNNMAYKVHLSKTQKKFKEKNYGLNFHYKRRTRVSTK